MKNAFGEIFLRNICRSHFEISLIVERFDFKKLLYSVYFERKYSVISYSLCKYVSSQTGFNILYVNFLLPIGVKQSFNICDTHEYLPDFIFPSFIIFNCLRE